MTRFGIFVPQGWRMDLVGIGDPIEQWEAMTAVAKRAEDEYQFSGKYYHVDRPINEPKGVRKPHPSLWIGGGGENVTLKLVAKYGDAGNFGAGDPDVVREKVAILKRHCDTLGRDHNEIIKSTNFVWLPVEAGEDVAQAAQRAKGGLDDKTFTAWTFVGTAEEMTEKVER